jgi:hypothetical protein
MSYLLTCTQGAGNQPMRASRLALVTVFQFLENLTDRQAADAVRSRLDWKYALPPGVNRSRLRPSCFE